MSYIIGIRCENLIFNLDNELFSRSGWGVMKSFSLILRVLYSNHDMYNSYKIGQAWFYWYMHVQILKFQFCKYHRGIFRIMLCDRYFKQTIHFPIQCFCSNVYRGKNIFLLYARLHIIDNKYHSTCLFCRLFEEYVFVFLSVQINSSSNDVQIYQ